MGRLAQRRRKGAGARSSSSVAIAGRGAGRKARLRAGLGWLLFVCFALGCARPRPPTVTPQVASVAGITPESLLLNVLLKVENPNSFPIAARSVTGELRVTDGPRLGTGAATPTQSIGARQAALVEFRVRVLWADLAVLAPLLLSPTLPYTFEGKVALGGSSLELNLPFRVEGQLRRDQLLAAGLRGLPGLPGLRPNIP